jgi:hypothetical protein
MRPSYWRILIRCTPLDSITLSAAASGIHGTVMGYAYFSGSVTSTFFQVGSGLNDVIASASSAVFAPKSF